MQLLAHALTYRPDTPTDVLARIATLHPDLTYAVLAHPAAPDALPRITDTPRALHTALHSPTATPTSRRRLLSSLHQLTIDEYVTEHTDAHPDAVNHAADGPLTAWAARAYLAHPAVTPDTHLAAVRVALTFRADHAAILTHATRHPRHLRDLADLLQKTARRPGSTKPRQMLNPATQLRRATHAHILGIPLTPRRDPHRARVTAITRSNLPTVDKIRHSLDPAYANTALTNATRPDDARDIAGAILETRELVHTDAAYRALHIVDAGPYHRDLPHPGDLPPERTNTRYTHAQLLTTPGHRAINPYPHQLLRHLDRALTTDPDALPALADLAHAAWPTYPTYGATLVHLALHPDITRDTRARLTTALIHSPDPHLVRTAAIANNPHTLTHTPLPDLHELAGVSSTHHYIAQTLARTLPTLDGDTLAAALTLETSFTGTLTELLETAHTITT